MKWLLVEYESGSKDRSLYWFKSQKVDSFLFFFFLFFLFVKLWFKVSVDVGPRQFEKGSEEE